jgi:hypothetical protein
MANIVENIIGDKALQLGNEEFIRQLSFGTDWQRLRIGLRWGVNMSATLATPEFIIGLCAGTTYGYRSASTVEFIGSTLAHGSVAWTYVAGPPAYFTCGWYRNYLKVGATTTTVQSNSAGHYGPILPTRGFLCLDVVKRTAANQLSVSVSQPYNVPTVQTDASQDTFFRLMEVDILPWIGSYNGSPIAFAYNGTYQFDSVNIAWNDNTNTVEISDLCVTRFY